MNPLLLEKFKDEIRPNIKSSDDQPPWMDSFFYSTNDPYTFLDLELIDFGKWAQPTLEEKYIRLRIYKNIQKFIIKVFPSAKVILYGSNSTDTTLPFGDIDIGVVIKDKDDYKEDVLCFLGRYLKLSGVISDFVVIPASVPIIKANDSGFNLPIDISVVTQPEDPNNLNSIAYMERNRNALSIYPSMYPVLMFLKFLLADGNHQYNENYQGGISSTLLFNMLLSVCQITEKTTKFSPSKLLLNFLWYYGDIFNPMRCVICTAGGGYLIENSSSEDTNKYPKFSFFDPLSRRVTSCSGILHYEIIKKFRAWNEKLRKELQYPCISKLIKLLDKEYINNLNKERNALKSLFQNDQEKQNKNHVDKRWNVVANFIMTQTKAIIAKRDKQKSNLPNPGQYKKTLKDKLNNLDK